MDGRLVLALEEALGARQPSADRSHEGGIEQQVHGDARRRARRRDDVAGPDALAVRPLPRLDGHIEMARGVRHVSEKRRGRPGPGAQRASAVHEQVVGLLPVAARHGVAGALEQRRIRCSAHDAPPQCRMPGGHVVTAKVTRGNRRGHASRVCRRATVNGVELEYEVKGSGEPVLLISPVAGGQLSAAPVRTALADRYRLIRYHKRGWAGSTHTPPPVSIADHVVDAAALLEHLDVPRAHIAGHSSGGAIALQMALDQPEIVHTLVLLEPSLLSVPGAGAFLQKAGPALEAYAAGDHEKALGDLHDRRERPRLGNLREPWSKTRIPGAVADALKDADTFFGVELPALTRWPFDARVGRRHLPAGLSVLGAETQPLWVEIAELLRSSLPRGRGVPDRGRRSPPAHPAPRARRPRDRAVPGAPWHELEPSVDGGRGGLTPTRRAVIGYSRPSNQTRAVMTGGVVRRVDEPREFSASKQGDRHDDRDQDREDRDHAGCRERLSLRERGVWLLGLRRQLPLRVRLPVPRVPLRRVPLRLTPDARSRIPVGRVNDFV